MNSYFCWLSDFPEYTFASKPLNKKINGVFQPLILYLCFAELLFLLEIQEVWSLFARLKNCRSLKTVGVRRTSLTSAPVCRDGAGGREAPAERRRLHQHRPPSAPKRHAAVPRQGQRGHQEHVWELQHRSGPSAGVSALLQAAGQVHAPVFLHLSVFTVDHYGNVWAGGMSSGYGYSTNPNNRSTTSTLYQSGQAQRIRIWPLGNGAVYVLFSSCF